MVLELLPLIKEVYRQTRLQNMPAPGTTRLVKLLYLSDLEWRRLHGGEPLAELDWRFLHFGPYPTELASLLGGLDVEETEFTAGKIVHRLAFGPEELRDQQVPDEVRSVVARLVKTWGDADLNTLLDYVYFETEPMENARRGERLNFSQLRRPSPPVPPTIDQGKLQALRTRLSARVRELKLGTDGLRVPINAYEGSQTWDEDDRSVYFPIGASIKFDGV